MDGDNAVFYIKKGEPWILYKNYNAQSQVRFYTPLSPKGLKLKLNDPKTIHQYIYLDQECKIAIQDLQIEYCSDDSSALWIYNYLYRAYQGYDYQAVRLKLKSGNKYVVHDKNLDTIDTTTQVNHQASRNPPESVVQDNTMSFSCEKTNSYLPWMIQTGLVYSIVKLLASGPVGQGTQAARQQEKCANSHSILNIDNNNIIVQNILPWISHDKHLYIPQDIGVNNKITTIHYCFPNTTLVGQVKYYKRPPTYNIHLSDDQKICVIMATTLFYVSWCYMSPNSDSPKRDNTLLVIDKKNEAKMLLYNNTISDLKRTSENAYNIGNQNDTLELARTFNPYLKTWYHNLFTIITTNQQKIFSNKTIAQVQCMGESDSENVNNAS